MSRGTLVPARHFCLQLQDYYLLRSGFPAVFASASMCYIAGPQPQSTEVVWFGLFRFRSPLLTESITFFLFLRLLRCFSSPGSRSMVYFIQPQATKHYLRRVSPFGYLRFYACLRLPVAFRSLPRPSSALGARASSLCSFLLDPLTCGSVCF